MTSTTAPRFTLPQDAPAAARTVLALLQRLSLGSLTVQLPDGSMRHFGAAPGQGPTASLMLRNWRVCSAVLQSGDIGFAQAYIDGDWSTPNLTALLDLFVANRRALDDVVYGNWFGRLVYRLRHLRNRNSKAGSARNIHAHYDLGNAFYKEWLDETMNYSSAWFEGDLSKPMPEAQDAKVRRALTSAQVKPGDRVLEIGCGWGALAEMGAREFGAHVTGVTLSTEQLAWGKRRTAGLPVNLRLQDYRDIGRESLDAPFDAICSIEMVEAVGRAYWPSYFEAVARLLKPGGRACIQSIVIDDALWSRYVGSTDFIQQYIFPGGCLPCPREFRREAQAAGLEVVDELFFGADYAETLRRWHERFAARRNEILQLGFDERFMRTWEFYLAYCEAAFARRNCDVVQFTLQKPSPPR